MNFQAMNEWETEAFEAEFDELESGIFSEAEEMELAAELLGVQSEAEMEQFFGKLFSKVARGVKSAVRSPAFRALGGMLKPIAGKLLPMAGAALGNMVVPGLGGVVGGKLASMAGSALGLELEGMDHDEMEFEVARRVVRLSGVAAKNTLASQKRMAPDLAARRGVTIAIRTVAPALPKVWKRLEVRSSGATSGRWTRRGGSIVLHGV
ncbi:MAG: hypothetical protein H6686_02960 [Fibrobacteria bacterium]|nr:hypothetical protein [Fibrobacteria bacterium]